MVAGSYGSRDTGDDVEPCPADDECAGLICLYGRVFDIDGCVVCDCLQPCQASSQELSTNSRQQLKTSRSIYRQQQQQQLLLTSFQVFFISGSGNGSPMAMNVVGTCCCYHIFNSLKLFQLRNRSWWNFGYRLVTIFSILLAIFTPQCTLMQSAVLRYVVRPSVRLWLW